MSLKTKWSGVKEILHFDNWLELLYVNIFCRKRKFFIYVMKGKEFLLRKKSDDINGLRTILTTNEYRSLFDGIEKEKEGINVVDIGANIGGFLFALYFNGFSIKNAVLVELNPRTFLRLRLNTEYNVNESITLLNAAVIGNNRELEISVEDEGTSANIYYNIDKKREQKTVSVKGITFDEIYERYFKGETVDLVKMDIEGAEYEIFESDSVRSITKCKNLIIEIHPNENRHKDTVLNKLAQVGFIKQKHCISNNPFVFLFRNSRFK